DAELLELHLDLATTGGGIAGVVAWDREFAAGQEVGALAGDRGQGRLRQRADDAGALHRAQRGGDPFQGAGNLRRRRERVAERGEGVGVVEVDHRGAGAEAAAQIDAELLDDFALHLGDRYLQHDLVAAVDGDAVDDALAVVDQARGDVERGL